MADSFEVIDNGELGDVTTSVSAWTEDETGSSAVLCVRTVIYGSEGLVGYGVQGTAGYIGNGKNESEVVGSGVLNGTETVVDVTHQWIVPKTHEGWDATCFAKSEGVVIGDSEAYPASDPYNGYIGYIDCVVNIASTTSYNVVYHANSTDAEGVPEQQIKWHDEPLTLSDVKPTRAGYTFIGWASYISATEPEYTAGTSYTANESVNLYAIWEINTWTVKYNINGGNEDTVPENQIKVYNETLKLSEVIPTRDEYIFVGWGTSSTDTTVDYNAGGDYTKNSAVTLYAIWVRTYDVTYNANGGTNAPEAQIKVSNITLSLSTSEPTKDNCDFVGWSTTPDGGVEYYPGSDYVKDIDVTLYAVWRNTDSTMKTLNSNEVYDASARDRIYGVHTSGTGDAYVASVNGINSLDVGVSITIIPHTTSTSSSPTLIVNGLLDNKGKAPRIRCRVSGNTASTTVSAGLDDNWIAANKPIKVIYDGIGWITDMTIPNANRLYGVVPIENGGTDADNATDARVNLGIETTNGTTISQNADYAEVGEWADGNIDAENRIGYFVAIDNATSGTTMVKATSISDVRGVTVEAPAFSGNCSNDKFDADGNLLSRYDYVAVMGLVSVIDDGTCTINGRCMPNDDAIAVPSPNNMGYQVIDRIDDNHILIAVEPGADMLVRIKEDVTELQNDIDSITERLSPIKFSDTGKSLGIGIDAPSTGLAIGLNTEISGSLTQNGQDFVHKATGHVREYLKREDSNYRRGTVPTDTQYIGTTYVRNSYDENLSYVQTYVSTDGNLWQTTGVASYDRNGENRISNTLSIGIDKDGNKKVAVSDAAVWRDALNAAKAVDSGSPVTTLTYCRYYLKNGLCTLHAASTEKVITENGTVIGTLPAAARPAFNGIEGPISMTVNNCGQFRITSAGVITLWSFAGNASYWSFSITYPV